MDKGVERTFENKYLSNQLDQQIVLCEYGCGEIAQHQFKNGKWCCSKNQSNCDAIKKIISEKSMEAWKKSDVLQSTEYKERLSKSIKKAWKDGKFDTIEWKKNQSEAHKGKKQSKETIEKRVSKLRGKQRIDLQGREPWNKGKRNVYSEETLQKLRKNRPNCNGREPWNKGLNLSLSYYKEKYPFFCKIETPRERNGQIQVRCKLCREWFTPTKSSLQSRISHLEHEDGNGGSFLYCSDGCKKKCPLYRLKNDPFQIVEKNYTDEEYKTFRNFVLERDNNICQYCEKPAEHVHHERPQKLEPFFALDPDYSWSVCKECHYKYGHKDECSTGKLSNKIC